VEKRKLYVGSEHYRGLDVDGELYKIKLYQVIQTTHDAIPAADGYTQIGKDLNGAVLTCFRAPSRHTCSLWENE
jgi:hypothetical protein